MDVSGVKKVHALAGGFHLMPQKEDHVRQTVGGLKEIQPDYIIPMRCMGETFVQILQQEMPDRFIRSYTASQYVFGT
jgi:7,8-dihydropterin-6-yl-methyl-4-(beta-D-ribofuranosyl)aminobenzene 5'-phosphate synthase